MDQIVACVYNALKLSVNFSLCLLLQDMVPKYMVDKSFGRSLYNSDFDGERVSFMP